MFASAGAGQDMGGSAGMLQVLLASGDGNGATSVDFDVHHFRGCYFVSF